METILVALNTYGYFAIVFGAIMEGESVIFLSGILAHQEILDISLIKIIIYASVGAALGDVLWFSLGRFQRTFIKKKFPEYYARGKASVSGIEKYPRFMSLAMRFMYGLRTLMPLTMGLSHVPMRIFIVWNALGAILWSTVISCAGFYSGELLVRMFGRVSKRAVIFAIAVALVMVGTAMLYRTIARRLRRVSKAPEDSSFI